MKKIGILTYHHVVNIGSLLQTYATYSLLSSIFPFSKIEIIDYYPLTSKTYNQQQGFAKSYFGVFPAPWRSLEKTYQNFLRQKCRFSPPVSCSDNPQEVIQSIEEQEYDVIFVGSDTVFQLDGYFGRPIAAPLPPNAYFLPNLRGSLKIGMAVSFDPVVPGETTNLNLSSVSSYLKDFDTILYRDSTSQRMLLDAGIAAQTIGRVPDPTIMFDVSHLIPGARDYSAYAEQNLAGVSIADPRLRKDAYQMLSKKGFTVIDIMQPPKAFRTGNNFLFDSIQERLSIYRVLKLLVTDRFHGSILGMQIGVASIIGIENADVYQQQNSKLRDLYSQIGIESKVLRCSNGELPSSEFFNLLSEEQPSRLSMLSKFQKLKNEGLESIERLVSPLLRS